MKTRLFLSTLVFAIVLSLIAVPAAVVLAHSAISLSPSQVTKQVVSATTSSCGSGFYQGAFSSAWEAKIRHGGAGGFRAKLDDQQLYTGGSVPWPKGGIMHLSLAYDSSTGYATMTVTGTSVPVNISDQVPGANGKILLTGKTSPEAIGTVVVSNVNLDGLPASPCSGFTAQGTDGARDVKYLLIDSVSHDFTLDCDVTFNWGCSYTDEGPALEIDIENQPLPTSTPPTSSSQVSTPAGSNVVVYPGNYIITYWAVISSGTTSVSTNAPNTCGGLPEKLQPEYVITFIEITTTATYGGPIRVGIPYDPTIVQNPKSLKVFHCSEGQWNYLTVEEIDSTNNIIYVRAPHLSLFLLGAPAGACFIATAAYGSPLNSHVDTLRSFRDHYMETNPIGSAFVSLYYKVSPPMADFIDKYPAFKPIIRVALIPAVAMSSIALSTTPLQKLLIMLALLASLSTVIALVVRQRVHRQRMH